MSLRDSSKQETPSSSRRSSSISTCCCLLLQRLPREHLLQQQHLQQQLQQQLQRQLQQRVQRQLQRQLQQQQQLQLFGGDMQKKETDAYDIFKTPAAAATAAAATAAAATAAAAAATAAAAAVGGAAACKGGGLLSFLLSHLSPPVSPLKYNKGAGLLLLQQAASPRIGSKLQQQTCRSSSSSRVAEADLQQQH
ncbi:hypothetical protein EBH_0022460 [Eimeria brunetti]|uniref:Uncharacterized protein n=1 Tax=Eimeria brunetti TaxID=51314 RepID=U6LJT8_9EIME|nr:hypothetical protein EBH_0022460 [Eimeria brunetti]